jgi:1-acyl-sn-glycerol-3-phosphate acyltransferase
MYEAFNDDRAYLSNLIKEYGGVDSYTTEQAATIFGLLCKMVTELGLNPDDRADFAEGVHKIFNFEIINMENYRDGKYVLVPNHVSEFDGMLYGTLISNMLVVAKSDWVTNPHLNDFVERYFSVVGVVRKDRASGINVIKKCMEHLGKSENSAVTIFVQQTIADIDITTPEDVASGACLIAKKTGAKIIPVYAEQLSTDHPTRMVFGSPLVYTDKNDFGEAWLKSEFALRDSIAEPPARPPVLCEKHRKPISERDF